MASLSVVYITFDSKKEAKDTAHYLLEKDLIACANIYEIDSLYKWEGKIVDEGEFVLWAKTRSDQIERIKKEVEERHSYDVPCVVHFPFDANAAYARWVDDSTSD